MTLSLKKHTNFSTNARIILAIAGKDITDAIKSKTILTTILSILFLLVFYKVMPSLIQTGERPHLALYDSGSARLVALLKKDPDLDFRTVDSQHALEQYLGHEDQFVLGLVLPPDFDQTVENASQIHLNGYVDHWISEDKVTEGQRFFEKKLTDLLGKSVNINIQQGAIYTQADGGHGLMLSLGMVLTLTFIGLSVIATLMIEEKETKTLDALLVSPATMGQIALGKACAGLVYCLAGTSMALMLNHKLIIHWHIIGLATLCGALFSVSLGLLLGTLFKVKQQLTLWSFVLLQPLIIPIILSLMDDLLPELAITIMKWIPTVALARTIRLAITANARPGEYIPELTVILGSAALLLVAVIWRMRRTQASA